jgi:hypothetical protein
MPSLTLKASELGNYVISVTFRDELGNAFTPDIVYWTVSDEFGTPVNDNEAVEISSPSSLEHILLTGNDLAIFEDNPMYPDDKGKRNLTVWGTFTSAFSGPGTPFSAEIKFRIMDLVGLSREIILLVSVHESVTVTDIIDTTEVS